MNISQIAVFIWLGLYGHILIYLKQRTFQGQDIQNNLLKYATDIPFLLSVLFILSIGISSWGFDALLRQRFKLSEMTAYKNLIVGPISLLARIFILWLSERTLADKINWNAALVLFIGTIISMWGSRGLINQ